MSVSSLQDSRSYSGSGARGEDAALGKSVPLIHVELRRLVQRYVGRPGHTPQTTASVNEANLRFIESGQVRQQKRAHPFAISAQLMRRRSGSCELEKKGAGESESSDPPTYQLPITSTPQL